MPILTSPFNDAIFLRGAVPASFPALHGKLIDERAAHVNLDVREATPVTVRTRITRSHGSGHLIFEYQLSLPEQDYNRALRMSIAYPGATANITFADYRVDGAGKTPPNYFESNWEETAAFRFDQGIAAGRDTRWCTVATTARDIKENGGTLKLLTGMTGVHIPVPAPHGTSVFQPMAMPADDPAQEPGASGEDTGEPA